MIKDQCPLCMEMYDMKCEHEGRKEICDKCQNEIDEKQVMYCEEDNN
jgi:hypothetical protein